MTLPARAFIKLRLDATFSDKNCAQALRSLSRCLVALLQLPVGSTMDRLKVLTTAVVEVVTKTYKRKHRDVYDGW